MVCLGLDIVFCSGFLLDGKIIDRLAYNYALWLKFLFQDCDYNGNVKALVIMTIVIGSIWGTLNHWYWRVRIGQKLLLRTILSPNHQHKHSLRPLDLVRYCYWLRKHHANYRRRRKQRFTKNMLHSPIQESFQGHPWIKWRICSSSSLLCLQTFEGKIKQTTF